MSKGFASNGRMTLLALAVLSCFLCVAVRLIFLHVIDRDDLLKFVERARRQIVVENARRGAILDTKGNILATSRSFVVLGADPELLRREDERNWPELARLLHVSSEQLVQLLRRGSAAHALALATPDPAVKERRIRWVKLADEVDESVYDRILALKVRGVYGTRDYFVTSSSGNRL